VFGNAQVSADFASEELVDVDVSRHGGTLVGVPVDEYGVVRALSQQLTAVRLEMPHERAALHA